MCAVSKYSQENAQNGKILGIGLGPSEGLCVLERYDHRCKWRHFNGHANRFVVDRWRWAALSILIGEPQSSRLLQPSEEHRAVSQFPNWVDLILAGDHRIGRATGSHIAEWSGHEAGERDYDRNAAIGVPDLLVIEDSGLASGTTQRVGLRCSAPPPTADLNIFWPSSHSTEMASAHRFYRRSWT